MAGWLPALFVPKQKNTALFYRKSLLISRSYTPVWGTDYMLDLQSNSQIINDLQRPRMFNDLQKFALCFNPNCITFRSSKPPLRESNSYP
jgi:hypothetical protein